VDLREQSHDEREDGDTNHHAKNAPNTLLITQREHVSVTDGR
jgi:hypothetical protein